MSKLLDRVNSPKELRQLNIDELPKLAAELRDYLIDTIALCGGHFASSLGALELTVALHYSFSTPEDKLIWDVGHQGYVHKMLTGRLKELATIRQRGGISGFLKREESEYDAFGAGHAGTSISAAVGMAVALQRSKSPNYSIACIGDGSLTCGMAFEALNHAGELGLNNLIVVLNDNEMSISPNVGAHRWLFSRALTNKNLTNARQHFKALHKKGYIPQTVYKMFDRAQTAAQGFFSEPALLFESFRFRYIGPVNGHSIHDVLEALEHAKKQDVPVLLHTKTSKGQGYPLAEADPIKWHAVKPFNRTDGTSNETSDSKTPFITYTKVFADTLFEIAQERKDIVAITAAMAEGTGLDLIRKELPEAFFDVGISEQHAVTFAAGLACEGYKPICAIYSTFLQRAYDQVIHDVCIQNLPVIFIIDRAGVVGNDGETHQGQFDLAYLRVIPNLTILAPIDGIELSSMLRFAIDNNLPTAIRFPRGNVIPQSESIESPPIVHGKSSVVYESGHDLLFLGIGPITISAINIARKLEKLGYKSTVVNMRFVKPIDRDYLINNCSKFNYIFTLEDHSLLGGLGSAIIEITNDEGLKLKNPVTRFGLKDEFISHGSQKEQLEDNFCSELQIFNKVRDIVDPL
jgi:1-deoxy-D-xylulose-5-phosphate synthase